MYSLSINAWKYFKFGELLNLLLSIDWNFLVPCYRKSIIFLACLKFVARISLLGIWTECWNFSPKSTMSSLPHGACLQSEFLPVFEFLFIFCCKILFIMVIHRERTCFFTCFLLHSHCFLSVPVTSLPILDKRNTRHIFWSQKVGARVEVYGLRRIPKKSRPMSTCYASSMSQRWDIFIHWAKLPNFALLILLLQINQWPN